ncbi:hypothetical protein CEXT_323111 [Caerostris extrusa]|uniref:Uncharacterized protein n=1 Tax=Caerostris extrusa TaxID=172846 RepID=A0AAV4N1J5_CAEEX|nr:hypothetical protein CEXT_323111 [Caerostris extrusa]
MFAYKLSLGKRKSTTKMCSILAERNGGVISYLCWRLWKGGARPLQETRLTDSGSAIPSISTLSSESLGTPSRRTRRFRAPGRTLGRGMSALKHFLIPNIRWSFD